MSVPPPVEPGDTIIGKGHHLLVCHGCTALLSVAPIKSSEGAGPTFQDT
jgi:hypothetical protein